MRYVIVSVVDQEGRPVECVRLTVCLHRCAASDLVPDVYTDHDGEAALELNAGNCAEIAIAANGAEKVRRGPIRGRYRITI